MPRGRCHLCIMNQPRLPGPRPGFVQRAAAALVGSVLLIGLFFAGLVAWVLIAGAALIGAAALSLWLWRKRRQFERIRREALRAAHDRDAADERGQDGETIEGAYVVLDEERRR